MTISADVFEAFLKCSTKCWLRAAGEPTSGNVYAKWVTSQNKSCRDDAAKRLIADVPANECDVAPVAENLKTAKWRLAVGVELCIGRVSTHAGSGGILPPDNSFIVPCSPAKLEASPSASRMPALRSLVACLHVVERAPSTGRGKPAQFIPIRFIFTNKLTKDDRLLLAFDAFVLSEALGREIAVGRIIHGEDHVTLKVRTSALAGEVQKRLEKIAALLSNPTPPDLVLNRHCAECEFQTQCGRKAIEKDDLSLLAGMSEKERKKLHSKGIFTVTELSYAFRPRRRPKRLRDRREKYHHSLKALAIRETSLGAHARSGSVSCGVCRVPSRLPPPLRFTPCWIAMGWSSPWLGAAVEPKGHPCPMACIPTISGTPIARASFSLAINIIVIR